MLLVARPSAREIEAFVEQSRQLPLSYSPVGLAAQSSTGFKIDEAAGIIGRGAATFELARQALREWRHFELGWVELFPKNAPTEPGTTVAVLVRHLGIWSLNGCKVVYVSNDEDNTFGFAYGTLTNHAEMGEEIFEVSISHVSEEVSYRIRAASRPRALFAKLGYPLTRLLQSRFRHDSIAAMRRAISA